MPLLLPNLDDRKWADLVDEGRSLVPVYGPEWSDHNPSNPGIMLTELLAFIAEMDIFQLNQISDRERTKFLQLVEITPAPPIPAEAVLRVRLVKGAPPLTLPAGVEFATQDSSSVETRYRTREPITLAAGSLDVLQCNNGSSFQDLTAIWQRRATVYPFGENPISSCEFYLGFSDPLPVDCSVQIFLTTGIASSSARERQRIIQEITASKKDCQPSPNPCLNDHQKLCGCHSSSDATPSTLSVAALKHYGVRLVWEFASDSPEGPQWIELDQKTKEVVDGTRSLTLDGGVVFKLPSAMAHVQVGAVTDSKYYLRCRLVAGSFDAAPTLQDVAYNGVAVRQSVPYGTILGIDALAKINYSSAGVPALGATAFIKITLNEKKKIVALDFNGDAKTDPEFLIYDFRPPKNGAEGLLAFEGTFLGYGDGSPNLQLTLPNAPIEASSFELYSLEANQWKRWQLRSDFDASTRRDLHAVLDATEGTVTFGDGDKGRVPPDLRDSNTPPREQCLIFAKYRTTRAEAGNLGPKQIKGLADSAHNRALLRGDINEPDQWPMIKGQIGCVVNPLPATGGMPAETLALAAGRADELRRTSDRAVTLLDYETLAKETPGTRIARVSACANLHPSFPCFKAPGLITVIVLPFLPKARPMPTQGLLQRVSSYLHRRRIIGTRVEVIGPSYLEVTVQAEVKAIGGTNRVTLEKSVVSALTKFLDPLVGGPNGTGWPLGRDVYRSEMMRIIDEVPGVDYVSSLALLGPDSQLQCGNICLSTTWLVASGDHQITVT
ncbi:MAG TPA: putative baseplate assembly protein [Terriglobales bacterium]|nr:putative baseplate assembly protein [Terriglobales bacterium]